MACVWRSQAEWQWNEGGYISHEGGYISLVDEGGSGGDAAVAFFDGRGSRWPVASERVPRGRRRRRGGGRRRSGVFAVAAFGVVEEGVLEGGGGGEVGEEFPGVGGDAHVGVPVRADGGDDGFAGGPRVPEREVLEDRAGPVHEGQAAGVVGGELHGPRKQLLGTAKRFFRRRSAVVVFSFFFRSSSSSDDDAPTSFETTFASPRSWSGRL